MSNPKNSFYKKLRLPKEILEVMRIWKKIKKQLYKDASRTGAGK